MMKLAWAMTVFLLTATAAQAVEVAEVTSPGGITAWLVEEHALPLVSVRVSFEGSGAAYDPPNLPGRASLAASLLDEGAGGMKDAAFNEAVEDRAIRLSFSADPDSLHAGSDSLSDSRGEALHYLSLALTRPRFDADAVSRVKAQTQTALQHQLAQPEYKLAQTWRDLAYGGHPYARPTLGTPAGVRGLTPAHLKDYAQRYLTRDRLLVVVVGDMTREELASSLDAAFGGLPATQHPDRIVPDVLLPKTAQQRTVMQPGPQTMVAFGGQSVPRSDPRYYAVTLVSQILGGDNMDSRLGKRLREKLGLTYAVSTILTPQDHASSWQGGFATRAGQATASVTALGEALAQFASEGPTQGELDAAKRYVIGSLTLSLDSNADLADFLLSMRHHRLGRDYLDRRAALLNAVTLDEAKEAARLLADPAAVQLATVGENPP